MEVLALRKLNCRGFVSTSAPCGSFDGAAGTTSSARAAHLAPQNPPARIHQEDLSVSSGTMWGRPMTLVCSGRILAHSAACGRLPGETDSPEVEYDLVSGAFAFHSGQDGQGMRASPIGAPVPSLDSTSFNFSGRRTFSSVHWEENFMAVAEDSSTDWRGQQARADLFSSSFKLPLTNASVLEPPSFKTIRTQTLLTPSPLTSDWSRRRGQVLNAAASVPMDDGPDDLKNLSSEAGPTAASGQRSTNPAVGLLPSTRARGSTLVGKVARLRRRRPKEQEVPSPNKASPASIQVEGYVVGGGAWFAKAFWTWGRWLYQDWLAQENEGLENLPLGEGVFFMASNHLSHLDCGATFMAAWAGGAKRVYALGARDYFFRNPLKAWFVTSFMNVIPISRRGFSQQEIEVLLQVKETSGPNTPTAILIFPEGTRSVTGRLQQFKAGVGLLAEQLDIPVVPVCVKGTFDALPKGRTIPFRHKIRVEFGKPVDFQSYAARSAPRNNAPFPALVVEPTSGSNSGSTCSGSLDRGASVQQESGSSSGPADRSQPSDDERRVRKETQKRFAEELRSAVLAMLGGYAQNRKVLPWDAAKQRPPSLAQRLGGGKWNLIGWLLYWLPMSCCMLVAVLLAASQVYRTGAGFEVAGRLVRGGGYAAAAGVFGGLQGVALNAKVFIALGIISVAFYARDFIQWLWPYVVLECRED